MTRKFYPLLLFAFLANALSAQTLHLIGVSNQGGNSNTGTIYSLPLAGGPLTIGHHFDGHGPISPLCELIQASNGLFYGTTIGGGEQNRGTIYSVEADGSNFTILHHFEPIGDGGSPYARLEELSDGKLYGTTLSGGNENSGTLFNIEKDGSGFSVVHHFDMEKGGRPFSNAIEASDGRLYGVTAGGGPNDEGIVYGVDKDGGNFEVLHFFDFSAEGGQPYSRLIEDGDGWLYGTMSEAGPTQAGGIFRIDKEGDTFEVLRNFSFSTDDSSTPLGGLIMASNGRLYGTSAGGGAEFKGTVFSISPDGSGFEIVHSFIGEEGSLPLLGHRMLEMGGILFGANFSGGTDDSFGTIYKVGLDGSDFEKIHDFDSGNGARPYAGLALGTNGNLFGLTSGGGQFKGGTFFEIAPDGTGHTIHRNFSSDNMGGSLPTAPLEMADDGWAYGTARSGGSNGNGAIYRFDPLNNVFEEVAFLDETTGLSPNAGLVQAADGWLYGLGQSGGLEDRGTIFRLMPGSDAVEVVYEFTALTFDGATPNAGFIEGTDGLLYSATNSGGEFGLGSVFSFDPATNEYTQIFSFDSFTTGYGCTDRLIEGTDGKLYGVTPFGGDDTVVELPRGTLFSLEKDGSNFNLLHTFSNTDDGFPNGSLIEGLDGMLYGTIGNGSELLNGALFHIGKDGNGFEVFHEFDVVNGTTPQDELLLDPNSGWIYGLTRLGGAADAGTIFRFNPTDLAFEKMADMLDYPDGGFAPAGGLLIYEMPSAAKERPALSGLALSPNPTAGEFRFVFENDFPLHENARLQISDGQGNIIFHFNGNLLAANAMMQPLAAYWPSGTYFFEVEMDGKFFSEKLLKR